MPAFGYRRETASMAEPEARFRALGQALTTDRAVQIRLGFGDELVYLYVNSRAGSNPQQAVDQGGISMSKLTSVLAAAILVSSVTVAQAAAPIVGNWTTASGETAKIAPCGNSFCTIIATGKNKGKRIGQMSGSGASYSGQITDPSNGKTYEGTAKVSGNSLRLTGCALKVFCRSQTWTRK